MVSESFHFPDKIDTPLEVTTYDAVLRGLVGVY